MDLIFEAKDGYITAGAISNKEWEGMCRALDRVDLIDDERFATPLQRGLNADERKQITADEIAKWPQKEILARLDEHDVPSAPLLNRMELLDSAQVVANGSVDRTVHEGFGEVRQARAPARFSATPSEISRPAPQLSEHSGEILEELGYDADRRAALFASGAVVAPKSP